MPIAPGLGVNRRQHLLGPDPADVPQRVFQHTLLVGDLGAVIGMLHRAAATDPEMRALRRHALGSSMQHVINHGHGPAGLVAGQGAGNRFTGQAALDEDGLALMSRHALTIMVERFDLHLQTLEHAHAPAT